MKLYKRFFPFLLFLASLTILVLAYVLEPDHSGIGTHQQLGLEPCGFLTKFQIPCMMCGMTTSFSMYMHVRIIDGVLNQPFSIIMFGGTVYTFFLSLLDVVDPRSRVTRFLDTIQSANRVWYIAIFLFFLGAWIFKIFYYVRV